VLSYAIGFPDTEPFAAAAAPSGGDPGADAPVFNAQSVRSEPKCVLDLETSWS
jgi:hypothetical protein